MHAEVPNLHRFKIRPHGAGWQWSVEAPNGDVAERGTAPSKAVAAACVVRATVRRVVDEAPR